LSDQNLIYPIRANLITLRETH